MNIWNNKNMKQQLLIYYIGDEPTNKRVIYSFMVFPGKVNPSSYLYTTSIILARLRIGASKSIETSLGLRHPSFISFHAFSIILFSSSIASFSDTPYVLIYESTPVADWPLSRSNFSYRKYYLLAFIIFKPHKTIYVLMMQVIQCWTSWSLSI